MSSAYSVLLRAHAPIKYTELTMQCSRPLHVCCDISGPKSKKNKGNKKDGVVRLRNKRVLNVPMMCGKLHTWNTNYLITPNAFLTCIRASPSKYTVIVAISNVTFHIFSIGTFDTLLSLLLAVIT